MAKVIKRIALLCFDFLRGVKWRLDCFRLRKNGARQNYSNGTVCGEGDVVLVVAPHADDELLSSYTVLIRTDCEVWVYYCGFTGSNQNFHNKEIRRKEIMKLCEQMNVPCVDGDGKKSTLEELLRKKTFNKIIIPSWVDWHSEHRKVSSWLVDICGKLNKSPEIYWYSVTVPMESDTSVCCVSMTRGEQKQKYRLFKRFYRSQAFMPLLRFRFNERINGCYSGCYAAETFMAVPFEKLKHLVDKFQLEENDGSDLIRAVEGMKYWINDIVGVREQSGRIYKEVENG